MTDSLNDSQDIIPELPNRIIPRHLTGDRYFRENQSLIVEENPISFNLTWYWN